MAKSFPNTGATVIDATADLPGSPSEGMMVFQKDTNELKIYDGASWVSMLDTDVPPSLNMVYGNTMTVAGAAGTETFINNVFSSAYDNYKILINVYSSSVGDQVRMRLQNSGTSSTASYYTQHPYLDNTVSGGWNNDGDNNVSYFRIAHPNNGSTQPDICTLDILAPNIARHTIVTGHCIQDSRYSRIFLAAHKVSTAYSGLSFHSVNGGTITANVRIYGYRNSI